MKLTNNTIMITGGTSGIGQAFANALSKDNKVIIVARNQAKLEQSISENPNLTGISADVSNLTEVQKLYQIVKNEHSELNMIIHAAGIMKNVNFFDENLDVEKTTAEININLNGTIYLNKTFLPLLAKNSKTHEAAMINVSSGISYMATTVNPVYSASKSAVNALTDSLSYQANFFGYKNLHLIRLAPPLIAETNLQDEMPESGPGNMKLDKFIAVSLRGISKNKAVINPGFSNLMKNLGKFAPKFIKMRVMNAMAKDLQFK